MGYNIDNVLIEKLLGDNYQTPILKGCGKFVYNGARII
jgi:hypothetical protein